VSALHAVQEFNAGATIESSVLAALAEAPLPLPEIARRIGFPVAKTEVFLRLLRLKGAVETTSGRFVGWRLVGRATP
jgi:DNA-binding IclR family transcriptional regulator